MEHLHSFYSYLQHEKCFSGHTITAYKTDLTQFTHYISKNFEVTSPQFVTYNMVRSWVLELKGTHKLNGVSIKRKLSAVRSYYKFLQKQGKVADNVLTGIKMQRLGHKKLPVYMEKSNMEQLLTLLPTLSKSSFENSRNQLIIIFFYSTGMRLSELANIKVADINMAEHTLQVIGKGNKQRNLPFNTAIADFISAYLSQKNEVGSDNTNPYLFITQKGEKIYTKLVYRIVKKYLEVVSTQKHLSPHVLRHTFATHLLNEGADLNAIKALLGHSSLAATQIYTHINIEKLKAVYAQTHPLYKKNEHDNK